MLYECRESISDPKENCIHFMYILPQIQLYNIYFQFDLILQIESQIASPIPLWSLL